jgi:hypothetical protein
MSGGGTYAETDLDNPEFPVDYSLIYAEDDEDRVLRGKNDVQRVTVNGADHNNKKPDKSSVSSESEERANKVDKKPSTQQQQQQQVGRDEFYDEDDDPPPSYFHDDAVRTYCTEGTPYSQTPYLISKAPSLTDLPIGGGGGDESGGLKVKVEFVRSAVRGGVEGASGRSVVAGRVKAIDERAASPEKPTTYCVEGWWTNFCVPFLPRSFLPPSWLKILPSQFSR